MTGQARVFVRQDTGDAKEFLPGCCVIVTTTMRSQRRERQPVTFYMAADGDRIDRMPDGRYQDKWGAVWAPQSTQ
jgi:hypothetical protein